MAIAYVIVAGTGIYSDRSEKPVRVFLSRKKAKEEMAILEGMAITDESLKSHAYPGAAVRAKRIEYENRGYIGLDGDEDWTLYETLIGDA
jgi:hypothetical protein